MKTLEILKDLKNGKYQSWWFPIENIESIFCEIQGEEVDFGTLVIYLKSGKSIVLFDGTQEIKCEDIISLHASIMLAMDSKKNDVQIHISKDGCSSVDEYD